jgi:hypothetical protein
MFSGVKSCLTFQGLPSFSSSQNQYIRRTLMKASVNTIQAPQAQTHNPATRLDTVPHGLRDFSRAASSQMPGAPTAPTLNRPTYRPLGFPQNLTGHHTGTYSRTTRRPVILPRSLSLSLAIEPFSSMVATTKSSSFQVRGLSNTAA